MLYSLIRFLDLFFAFPSTFFEIWVSQSHFFTDGHQYVTTTFFIPSSCMYLLQKKFYGRLKRQKTRRNGSQLKAFVLSLQPTLKIALSKRLMTCKNLTLKTFWWELLPNNFRIRKFRENPSLRFQGLVIWTSFHPKILSI